MLFSSLQTPSPLRAAVRAHHRIDEDALVSSLVKASPLTLQRRTRTAERARAIVERARARGRRQGGIDAFLVEYGLSSREGIVLMCMAEALLRIPDRETADALIRDKLAGNQWASHLGHSDSWFVNASTVALMLTGRVLGSEEDPARDWRGVLGRAIQRSGEPVIRQAVGQAMRILGRQFVMGRDIDEALARARGLEAKGFRYSYDMLGEAARTEADARAYIEAYRGAIEAVGAASAGRGPVASPGVSVKLSALHPRFELTQAERVFDALYARTLDLAKAARSVDIGLTLDAEEADRLDLSLDIIEALMAAPELADWQGLGVAVQAYQKRALSVIDWLIDRARHSGRRLMVRLVKGAYWDSEIKWAQERGVSDYPVFTRKSATDLNYIACVERLFSAPDAVYPQLATHNAHSVSVALELAGPEQDFEFQRLHGMGEALYQQLNDTTGAATACRIYAPVGSHQELLPYLVRRLLENGANSSFVHQIQDPSVPIERLIEDPIARLERASSLRNPRIPRPHALFLPQRDNSQGIDLGDPAELADLASRLSAADRVGSWRAGPLIGGVEHDGGVTRQVMNPARADQVIGRVVEADDTAVGQAMTRASAAFDAWQARPAEARAGLLEAWADALEADAPHLIALCIREAGKILADAHADIREAADFCRYYAGQLRQGWAGPRDLAGPTGEHNQLSLHGRGVFVCISPWNFPVAIFTGQIAAALAAGNTVVAKPAEQTGLIGVHVARAALRAGIPGDVLHCLPGDGAVGAALVRDPRAAGVAFTGSTHTARRIAQALAERPGPLVPLIAETGGQNAMIVDSSALPEQVVRDVVTSAFRSAGQRCSALRVLYVQDVVAERVLTMLAGAMDCLVVGDPTRLATDVGPVIDAEAKRGLEAHIRRMQSEGREIGRAPSAPADGHFIAPIAFEIDGIERLDEEVFGPTLHVVRYGAEALDAVLDAINATGYGLTLGVHSRLDATIERIRARARVGNLYVNRNMIGAVVGAQPFGGEGLSGTGPKAGGPNYLTRFAVERVVSTDTTAAGGNASLLGEAEDGDGASGSGSARRAAG
mgnify:CR=1 FL=1